MNKSMSFFAGLLLAIVGCFAYCNIACTCVSEKDTSINEKFYEGTIEINTDADYQNGLIRLKSKSGNSMVAVPFYSEFVYFGNSQTVYFKLNNTNNIIFADSLTEIKPDNLDSLDHLDMKELGCIHLHNIVDTHSPKNAHLWGHLTLIDNNVDTLSDGKPYKKATIREDGKNPYQVWVKEEININTKYYFILGEKENGRFKALELDSTGHNHYPHKHD